jgi:guanylate kinase
VRPGPFVVVLSAPSGAGKTTLAQALVRKRDDVGFSVSATTRAPRRGERDGEAYHFISRAEFAKRRRRGDFLECAEYAGEWYGTLKREVQRVHRLRRHVLLDIDIEGARQVRRTYDPSRTISIFVLPPSPSALVERLRRRRSESRGSLSQRLERAIEELREAESFDYIVVNDVLRVAVAQLSSVLDAEELRTARHLDLKKQLDRLSTFLKRRVKALRITPKTTRAAT